MAKSTTNYFQMIDELVGYSVDAARSLYKILTEFDASKLDDASNHLHSIEHAADLKKHDLMEKLLREFITPIDSGDIFQIAQEVDNVTDAVEDVLKVIHMYNVTRLRTEVIPFTETVVKCVETLKAVTGEFHNFRKSTTLKNHIIEVNRLEEVADKYYIDAMHRLFRDTSNAAELLIWKDIFGTLEDCCDAAENVADVIESVIMKNT